MADLLGTGQCVVRGCTSTKARFTLSRSGLAVCTDKQKGGCGSQCFARDEEGDELFRACINAPGQTANPPPAPVRAAKDIEPGPIAENDDEDQGNHSPPPPPPAPKGQGWGMLRG